MALQETDISHLEGPKLTWSRSMSVYCPHRSSLQQTTPSYCTSCRSSVKHAWRNARPSELDGVSMRTLLTAPCLFCCWTIRKHSKDFKKNQFNKPAG